MNISKNMVLWVALAIPVFMILFVAAAIYIPQRGIEAPQYSFVYALRNYSDGYEYTVVDGNLTRREIAEPGAIKPTPAETRFAPTRFFLYDVRNTTSRELAFEEVQTLSLDNNVTSPDGYEMKRGGEGGGVFPFFFSEGNYNKQYLVKGNRAIELELKQIGEPYYYNQSFIGWVIK